METQITRYVYRAQCKPGSEQDALHVLETCRESVRALVEAGELLSLSIFRWESHLFLYYECTRRVLRPEELYPNLAQCLELWPGEDEKRCWVPMMDIYHCAEPASVEFWKRSEPRIRPIGRVAWLKPEMVSSYIFYHFLYQEEKPGDWAKYPLIGLYENFLFFYTEGPDVRIEVPYKGKLQTSLTPPNWMEVMKPHFIFWEDAEAGQEIWKTIDLVYQV